MKPAILTSLFLPLWIGLFLIGVLLWAFARPQPLRSEMDATRSQPVLLHPASQEFPAIDGSRIVWQDTRNGPADIYLADVSNGAITNLTQTPGQWEAEPALAGDFVVWRDGYHGIGIHGIDLNTQTPFTVTTGQTNISRPRLSGATVVWTEDLGNASWAIVGFDLISQTRFVIASSTGLLNDPQIDGNLVVWWDQTEQILLHDLATRQTITLHNSGGARLPDVSAADQLVVWQDLRHGNWDIYGYDLQAQREISLVVAPGDQENVASGDGMLLYHSKLPGGAGEIHAYHLAEKRSLPLTDNSSIEQFPAAAGQRGVWQDSRDHQWDLYTFVWGDNLPPPVTYPLSAPTFLEVGALPAGRLVVRWQDRADNETGYQVERSQGITGANWVDYATLPPNTAQFTDTPGIHGESYWYRVYAFNDSGRSSYSNGNFNTIFDATPNVFEAYLMVLVNEVRADPARFGYPEYPPVPPLAYHPLLGYSARAHSQSILNSVFQFGHCDPAGRCPEARARAAGYNDAVYCTENLIRGANTFDSITEANRSFVNSPGHRDSMLHEAYTDFAAGHVYDAGKGDTMHGNVAEVFCRRDGVQPPAIPGGVVVPHNGPTTTTYTYTVNYYSATGDAPSQAEVLINGAPHALELSSGRPSHGAYRLVTTLPAGDQHTYSFRFTEPNGTVHTWPETGAINFPDVYEPDNPFTPTPTFTVMPAGPVTAVTNTPTPSPVTPPTTAATPTPTFTIVPTALPMTAIPTPTLFPLTPPAGGTLVPHTQVFLPLIRGN